jgi:hypothetical protein
MQIIFSAFVISAALSTAQAADGPIDAASLLPNMKAGQWLCESPNIRAKTCETISQFEVTGENSFIETSRLLIDDAEKIVMTLSAPMQIKNGRTCGVLTPEIVERFTFEVKSVRATEAESKALHDRIRADLEDFIGPELCQSYAMKNGSFVGVAYVGGEPLPDGEFDFIWVSPMDGYTIGPK